MVVPNCRQDLCRPSSQRFVANVEPDNTHLWTIPLHVRRLIIDDNSFLSVYSLKDVGKKLTMIMLMTTKPKEELLTEGIFYNLNFPFIIFKNVELRASASCTTASKSIIKMPTGTLSFGSLCVTTSLFR